MTKSTATASLTAMNGATIKVDCDYMDTLSPHIDGGSVLVIRGVPIHVKEDVNTVLSKATLAV